LSIISLCELSEFGFPSESCPLVATLLCNLTQVEPAPVAQAKAFFFIAHCYAYWYAVTLLPNTWTIW
jgi:hypothetical protein